MRRKKVAARDGSASLESPRKEARRETRFRTEVMGKRMSSSMI